MLEDAKYSPPGTYRPTHRDLPLPSITLFLVALTGAFLLVAFVGMGIVGSAWTDGMGLLVIVLGITAFVQGLRLRNIWNRTRSALAVLWYLDSQEPYLARRVNLREWVRWGTSVGQGSSDTRQYRSMLAQIEMEQEPLPPPSLFNWRIWDERANVLVDLKRYAEAIESHLIAKEGEVLELWSQKAKRSSISMAEERHDDSVAYIRSLMEDEL